MRKISSGMILAALLGVSWSWADSPPEAQTSYKLNGHAIQLAHYAKAFIGPNNVTVEVAPYKQGDQAGAILIIHGIESDWDGKALDHKIKPAAYSGQTYVTQYKGEDWHTLTSRENLNGSLQYEMFVPGIKDSIILTPSDGAAQLTTPLKIFQEYQQQHASKGESPK